MLAAKAEYNTIHLQNTMTNYFCALVLFDYPRDTDYESEAKQRLVVQSLVTNRPPNKLP